MNGKQTGNNQHQYRQTQQDAHRHLDSAEPPHADDVNDIKEKQTADRQRLVKELAAETFAREFDHVIRQRARQVSARADVSDDL